MLGQNVPYISAFGMFGVFVTGLGVLLVLSLVVCLQTIVKRKRRSIQATPTGRFEKIIQWKIWRWLIFAACLIIGISFLELRPKLPYGLSPSAISLPIASYREMSKNAIFGKTVIITAVPRNLASPMALKDKTFQNCLIIGPAVLAPTSNNAFVLCQFGVLPSGVNSILLQSDSTMRIGMIEVQNCKFIQCQFLGISFVGDAHFLDDLRKSAG